MIHDILVEIVGDDSRILDAHEMLGCVLYGNQPARKQDTHPRFFTILAPCSACEDLSDLLQEVSSWILKNKRKLSDLDAVISIEIQWVLNQEEAASFIEIPASLVSALSRIRGRLDIQVLREVHGLHGSDGEVSEETDR